MHNVCWYVDFENETMICMYVCIYMCIYVRMHKPIFSSHLIFSFVAVKRRICDVTNGEEFSQLNTHIRIDFILYFTKEKQKREREKEIRSISSRN